MLNDRVIAYIKIVLTMCIWAGTFHVAKLITAMLDPYTSSFLRWGSAGIILAVMLVQQKSWRAFIQPKSNWVVIVLIGFFAIFVYNVLFFSAETFLPANLISIIMAFTPCITLLISYIFFKEKINYITLLGICIAFLGAVFAINLSTKTCARFWCSSTFSNIGYGEILSFLMCICMALYGIFLKSLSKKSIDSLTITALSSIVAAIMLFFVVMIRGGLSSIYSLSLRGWWLMLYLSLFGSVISYKWYSDALKVIGCVQSVIFINSIPIFAIILGAMFFNVPVELPIVIAAILVVFGVIITNYSLDNK